MKLNDAEQNAFEALDQLLRLGQVKVTSLSLKNALWQHPDFPSLTALSDVLNDFKVPNLATRISPDRLADIPTPALAHLTTNGGSYAPIRKVGDNIEWLDTQRGWQTENLNEFIHKWEGVTLLAQPDQVSGEVDYTEQRQKEVIENLRVPFAVGALLLCFGMFIYHLTQQYNFGEHWRFYALIATKTLGTVISGLLVWYGIDSNNSFLQSVCKINDSTNCNNILSSPAAKVFSWLSWSEVGLFYFVGGLIVLLTASPLTATAARPEGGIKSWIEAPIGGLGAVFGALSVLALPYTFYSFYYQAFVARQWCVLCLAIQALIWIEFILFSTSTSTSLLLSTESGSLAPLLGAGGAFLIIPALWALLKPYLQKAMPYEPLIREFQKVKFDPDFLNSLLSKQRYLPPIFEGMKVIEMGNVEAENTLILVSNPTCAACRRNHLALEKLLKANDSIKCQIILAANPQDEAGQVALQVLSLSQDLMAEALHSWFETDQKFKHWSKKNKGNFEDPTVMQQLALHLRWVELAGITAAPKTFLNSVEIPKFYSPEELLKLVAVFSKDGFANQK